MSNTQYILAHHLRHLTDTELAVTMLAGKKDDWEAISKEVQKRKTFNYSVVVCRIWNYEATAKFKLVKEIPKLNNKEIIWRGTISHLTDNELLSLDIYPEQQDLLDAEVNKRFPTFGSVLRRCLRFLHCKSMPKWRELLIKKYREAKRSESKR